MSAVSPLHAKRRVEYSFRNSTKDKEVNLKLGVKSIEISSDHKFRSISYDEITEVRLNYDGNIYTTFIATGGKESLQLTNFSYRENGEQVDQSRAYLTFVRVLHVHLYGKTKTYFRTGSRKTYLALCATGFAGILALSFLTSYFFGAVRMIPMVIVASLIIPGFLLLYRLRPSQWPKSYDPSSLPTHLLPPAA
jgi:hypothetical protein